MPIGRRKDQAAQDTQTLARVRGALEGYLASTGPGASVSVAHVLDLLNPRGMWSLDPERRKDQETALQTPSPGLDPMTGCKWAGPAGSVPQG